MAIGETIDAYLAVALGCGMSGEAALHAVRAMLARDAASRWWEDWC